MTVKLEEDEMNRSKKNAKSNRYSEAFKQSVVVEVESGRATIGSIRRRYGINGTMTVNKWIRRYGRKTMKPQKLKASISRIGQSDERLQQENRELRAALAQVTMEKVLLESLIQESEESLGVDLRKNFGMRR